MSLRLGALVTRTISFFSYFILLRKDLAQLPPHLPQPLWLKLSAFRLRKYATTFLLVRKRVAGRAHTQGEKRLGLICRRFAP